MAKTRWMTDRARFVMALAEQEAQRRGAAAVEPEHVLLALALEGAGVAAVVLRNLGASADLIAQLFPSNTPAAAGGTEALTWAASTNQVVVQAHAERVPLRHNYVGTEHLVLAIARAGEPVAATLSRLGITPEAVRGEVYAILGHELESSN